jgi:hypothetical protein
VDAGQAGRGGAWAALNGSAVAVAIASGRAAVPRSWPRWPAQPSRPCGRALSRTGFAWFKEAAATIFAASPTFTAPCRTEADRLEWIVGRSPRLCGGGWIIGDLESHERRTPRGQSVSSSGRPRRHNGHRPQRMEPRPPSRPEDLQHRIQSPQGGGRSTSGRAQKCRGVVGVAIVFAGAQFSGSSHRTARL